MRHVMALVADVPGVLRRIIGLYSSRGYTVRGLTVGPGGRLGTLRINVTLDETADRAQRFARQLERLIDVISVDVADEQEAVARELALIKVAVGPAEQPEVMQVAEIFRARVVDATPQSLVLEITGGARKIDAFIEVLKGFGISEVARSGAVALRRGGESLPEAALDRQEGASGEVRLRLVGDQDAWVRAED